MKDSVGNRKSKRGDTTTRTGIETAGSGNRTLPYFKIGFSSLYTLGIFSGLGATDHNRCLGTPGRPAASQSPSRQLGLYPPGFALVRSTEELPLGLRKLLVRELARLAHLRELDQPLGEPVAASSCRGHHRARGDGWLGGALHRVLLRRHAHHGRSAHATHATHAAHAAHAAGAADAATSRGTKHAVHHVGGVSQHAAGG
eukprot:scaffold56164_cov61-Phaeocystis_antarctica.AAC.6